jgi:hypothetical protein
MVPTMVLVGLLLFAIALLFIFPIREVTQPPGKLQPIWEVLFPGTSPAWHALGGLVLAAWGYIALQDLLLFAKGTPYLLFSNAFPNLTGAYGIPPADLWRNVFRLVNPSWIWVYLAPAFLFAVNLFLVLRSRGRA